MIITDKFVMLNFPKTGSTFVRKMLKKVHSKEKLTFLQKIGLQRKRYFENYWVENIRDTTFRANTKDEHGLFCQIPESSRDKIIVSVKRDVFERYVSLFEYGDWKKTWGNFPEVADKYPNFPNLRFEQYMDKIFNNNPFNKHPKINRELPIGPATTQFILFYFKNPFNVLQNINEEYMLSDNYKEDISKVFFLDQKNLNKELYEFLIKMNYKKNEISFILDSQKENVSVSDERQTGSYYTKELIDMVNLKDSFLLKILNDYKLKKTNI